MKLYKSTPGVLLLIITLLVIMTSCNAQTEEQPEPLPPPVETEPEIAPETDMENEKFQYSKGLDENGYWEGVRALDYVEMFKYEGISIPKEVYEVSDEDLQTEIDNALESFTVSEQVKDRAVKDGDTVNIDYIGSVDGVEFEGGNTNGTGTEVTIGVTNYIDDFLEQLIGHRPGETFNVEVTFPDDYGVEELNGKDAVFITTVNHIVEYKKPELTDSFVEENFADKLGLKTVEEFKDRIREDMRKSKIKEFIMNYMYEEVKVKSIPDFIMTYQEGAMIEYYKNMADSYGMGLEDLLGLMELENLDALFEVSREGNMQWARYSLASQAIAEDLKIIISEQDVADHFKNNYGMDDYSYEVELYGLPYLKQMVMYQHVMDYLIDHAVFEE